MDERSKASRKREHLPDKINHQVTRRTERRRGSTAAPERRATARDQKEPTRPRRGMRRKPGSKTQEHKDAGIKSCSVEAEGQKNP